MPSRRRRRLGKKSEVGLRGTSVPLPEPRHQRPVRSSGSGRSSRCATRPASHTSRRIWSSRRSIRCVSRYTSRACRGKERPVSSAPCCGSSPRQPRNGGGLDDDSLMLQPPEQPPCLEPLLKGWPEPRRCSLQLRPLFELPRPDSTLEDPRRLLPPCGFLPLCRSCAQEPSHPMPNLSRRHSLSDAKQELLFRFASPLLSLPLPLPRFTFRFPLPIFPRRLPLHVQLSGPGGFVDKIWGAWKEVAEGLGITHRFFRTHPAPDQISCDPYIFGIPLGQSVLLRLETLTASSKFSLLEPQSGETTGGILQDIPLSPTDADSCSNVRNSICSGKVLIDLLHLVDLVVDDRLNRGVQLAPEKVTLVSQRAFDAPRQRVALMTKIPEPLDLVHFSQTFRVLFEQFDVVSEVRFTTLSSRLPRSRSRPSSRACLLCRPCLWSRDSSHH